MKKLILCLTLLATTLCHAQQAAKPQDEFVRLLTDVSSTEQLLEYNKLLNQPFAQTNKEAVEHARERIEKAKKAIPKIRKLIVIGTSVFDYPGLLAHGRITYDESSGYDLYFGAYFRGGQGSAPYDFWVTFNRKGVVTDVKNVIYKK